MRNQNERVMARRVEIAGSAGAHERRGDDEVMVTGMLSGRCVRLMMKSCLPMS